MLFDPFITWDIFVHPLSCRFDIHTEYLVHCIGAEAERAFLQRIAILSENADPTAV